MVPIIVNSVLYNRNLLDSRTSKKVKVAQSCPTLCDPMDYTVCGILQARILEWVAILFSRRSSQSRNRTRASCIAGRFFTCWATREARIQFSSVQSLSCVRLFATPWNAARQASLSITKSRSSPKLMCIKSVMPSSHLILCRPLLLLPSIAPSISLFQWVNSSHEVAKVLEFQL